MIPMAVEEVRVAIGAVSWHRDLRGACSTRPPQVRRVTTDSRDVRPGDLFFAIRGERFDGHRFIPDAILKGAVACVGSRTTNSACPTPHAVPLLLVDDPVEALGRLAAYYRKQVVRAATIVVAVTGSNGKTTTKCMIDHVLGRSFPGRAAPRSFNNQIGVPLTLLSVDPGDRYVIVEIGSNAPGEVAALAAMASPTVGVVTSIGEAHLEGLGGIDGVAKEKASLLVHVRSGGLAVVNTDRPQIKPYLSGAVSARVVTLGVSSGVDVRLTDVSGNMRGTRFMLDGRFAVELPVPGFHHATSAAAAFVVARWFGVAPERIVDRLRSFKAPPGRTRVSQIDGVTLVDDAYNANPASMAAAINTLTRCAPGRRVLVMGDMLELGQSSAFLHDQAVSSALDAGVDVLVAVGPAMARAVRSVGPGSQPGKRQPGMFSRRRIIHCEDAAEASDMLMTVIAAGDTVWIKASRAVGLDRVVRDAEAHLRRRRVRPACACPRADGLPGGQGTRVRTHARLGSGHATPRAAQGKTSD